MSNTIRLQRVIAEIAEIEPAYTTLLDRFNELSSKEARAMKLTPAWQTVERYTDLVLQRAQLRQEVELDEILGA